MDSASREADREFSKQESPFLPVIAVAHSGLEYLRWRLTQGSQSLALGLTLIAATQLRLGRITDFSAQTTIGENLHFHPTVLRTSGRG